MGELETPEERAGRFGRIDDAVAAIEDALFPLSPDEEATARRLLGDQDVRRGATDHLSPLPEDHRPTGGPY